MDKLVNDCKDIFSVIPGPDVGIATNDHEDIENSDNESEMIETVLIEASANKMQHMIWIKMAVSHKSEGKCRSEFTNSSRLTSDWSYEHIWSLHSRHFADFLIQDFDLKWTV